tara:strand:- start:5979 stop:6452 length:474 start_codon:yes stop_codon:yes gene_type:complete
VEQEDQVHQRFRLLAAAGVVGLASFGAHSLAENAIEREKAAACQPVEVSVYFAPGQTELNDFAEDLLRNAVGRVQQCELAQIDVTGYADATGQSSANYRISELRAEAALEYLLNNNVTANQINITAKGDEGALLEDGVRAVMRRKADLRIVPVQPTA